MAEPDKNDLDQVGVYGLSEKSRANALLDLCTDHQTLGELIATMSPCGTVQRTLRMGTLGGMPKRHPTQVRRSCHDANCQDLGI